MVNELKEDMGVWRGRGHWEMDTTDREVDDHFWIVEMEYSWKTWNWRKCSLREANLLWGFGVV